MTGFPERWLRPALLGWGLVCGLVVGPAFLFFGVRSIVRGQDLLDTVGGWFMAVGGVVALGGGLTMLVLLKRKRSER